MLPALALAAAPAALAVEPEAVVYEDGAAAPPLTEAPGDPAAGREVVGNRSLGNCVACHRISEMDDVPWHGEVGPPLDGAGDRWSEAELRGILADAKQMFWGTMMPSFYKVGPYVRPGDGYTGKAAKTIEPILTAQQIEDTVAYLRTLKE